MAQDKENMQQQDAKEKALEIAKAQAEKAVEESIATNQRHLCSCLQKDSTY